MSNHNMPLYRSANGVDVRAAPITAIVESPDGTVALETGMHGRHVFDRDWCEHRQPQVGAWLVLNEHTGGHGVMSAEQFSERFQPVV